jgi:hypothetical protein
VGDAVADVIRDCVHGLLGSKGSPHDPYRDQRDHHAPDYYRDGEDDPWGDEDRRWEEEDAYASTRETQTTSKGATDRWRNAVSAALQAALWFVKQQPRRRRVLTTLAVTLAAGVTGFVAGPVLAAGAGVLASVAGLMLTADASKSAAELASG